MHKVTVHLAGLALAAGLVLGIGSSPAGATPINQLEPAETAVSYDLGAIAPTANQYDIDGLETACQQLQVDAGVVVNMTRPHYVPRRAWRLERRAMRLFVDAGEQCEIGARDMDTDALHQATSLITESTGLLHQAADSMAVS